MKKKILYLFLLLSTLRTVQAYPLDQFEVEIKIKDHHFIPSEVNVPSNMRIKLIIYNLDNTAEEFECPDLKREKIIPGGGKINVIFGPLQPGKYHFFGEFNAETAKGELIVE